MDTLSLHLPVWTEEGRERQTDEPVSQLRFEVSTGYLVMFQTNLLPSSSGYNSFAFKIRATPVKIYQTTRRHVTENSSIHTQHNEKFKTLQNVSNVTVETAA
jgi:hypothetical protein